MKKYFTKQMLTLYAITLVFGALVLWLIDKPIYIATDFFVGGMFFKTYWDKYTKDPELPVVNPLIY